MTSSFSDFYLRFENHFRGSREDIKNRQSVYRPLLDLVKQTEPATPQALDIGCGRGEWLENLKKHGWHGYGRDINDAMVAECCARGLDVEEGDALAHLRSLPDNHLNVISGFHIVEHLPFELVVELLAESLRVLKPGGIVILETPNPENVQVGGHTFYLDPTHIRPIPPALLAFVAKDAGFSASEILRLHPYLELGLSRSLNASTIEQHANQLAFGPQDYALVAMKTPTQTAQRTLDLFSQIIGNLNMQGVAKANAMGDELRQAQEQLAQIRDELNQTRATQEQAHKALENAHEQIACHTAHIEAIQASTSWKITLPLRKASTLLRSSTKSPRTLLQSAKTFAQNMIRGTAKATYSLTMKFAPLRQFARRVLHHFPFIKHVIARLLFSDSRDRLLALQTPTAAQTNGTDTTRIARQNILAQLQNDNARTFPTHAIHQFVHTCIPGDGVSNGVLFTQKLLRTTGIESEIFSINIHKDLAAQIRSFKHLNAASSDALLLVHHSCGYDEAKEILALPMPKVMIYHNITPAEFFSETDPLHHYCQLGREQLYRWPANFLGAIGDSELNTAELLAAGYRNAKTVPLLVDLQKIQAHPWNSQIAEKYTDTFNILFIGRIVENKCQHELIDVTHLLRTRYGLPVKLLLAGGTSSPAYLQQLKKQIEHRQLQDSVELLGKVPEDDLYALYRCADAFVCLSEHEGFGMPLIEAMAFGVPVLACSRGNIPNTLGQGGILLTDKTPATVAEAIALLASEPGIRRQILQRQQESLSRFETTHLQGQLLDYLGQLGIHIPEPARNISQANETDSRPVWRVEGPIQGSYSLAFVNRGVARGLAQTGLRLAARSMDGGRPIPVDPAFKEREPDLARMLENGQTGVAEVCLRDCYPPYTIGMQANIRLVHAYGWEESAFPERYVNGFNQRLDMVTVLSREVARSLRDSGVRLPIAVVGAGVDHQAGIAALPENLDLGSGFRFLHVSSCFPRKGVDVLLRAFGRAFSARDDVTLIIKTFPNPHNTVEADLQALQRQNPDAPKVRIISQDWPDSAMLNALYQACDAFVAPSRGEGFGLPLAEAMLQERPVITLAAGGQTDFCTPDTAWLCDYHYAPAQTHLGVTHSAWREPDEDDLIRCLRDVHAASPAEIAQKTGKAKAWVQNECTWTRVAQRTRAAIDTLNRMPLLNPAPAIGWISSWNTRCGIANYSDYLLNAFPPDRVHILANNSRDLVRADDNRVTRCWEFNQEPLQGIIQAMDDKGLKALVIQYNFGFFSLQALAHLLQAAKTRNIATHLFLHSTKDVIRPDFKRSLREELPTLQQIDRIYVHGIDDWNYLKQMGLDSNVTLFPHGVLAPQQQGTPRIQLKQPGRKIIATYGFLLPHKGIVELVQAFAELAQQDTQLHLLLANALYPAPASAQLSYENILIITELGITERVTRVHDFLPDQESLGLLGQADLIVFPYQHTQESSSAAVRMGLAAGSAVAVTPLPIFDDVRDAVLQLPGTEVSEIAQGIRAFLGNAQQLQESAKNARHYCEERAWPRVSHRLLNIIDGLEIQNSFDQQKSSGSKQEQRNITNADCY